MSKFVQALIDKFGQATHCQIPKQGKNRDPFIARLVDGGIEVDCLGTSPFLPWGVFEAVEQLLESPPNKSANRGSAMNSKLGDAELPIDSVEGCIAIFYGQQEGESVFRRISPVANLLVWAGVCQHGAGILELNS